MNDTPTPSLESLGWDSAWADLAAECSGAAGDDVRPCRVSRVDRGGCVVLTGDGPVRATLGGRVLDRMAADATSAPCTGDWSVVRTWPDGPVTVEAVLPRRTAVVRADVSGTSRGQVLAANVDVAAVVVGLQPEPVIARVERLLTLAWASGAQPVVVLTKSDLVGDAEQIAADIAVAAPRVPVLVCSTVTGEGVDDLARLFDGERTLGLLGASGAGKSSLVNTLAGSEVLRAREIRADGRGRHTTVRRELVPMPGGGVVIDTPGMRGLGLVDSDAGLAATFADVEALAAQCRFGDCSHTSEPGCAVLEGVETGDLPVRRLESWRMLRQEMEQMAARSDARLGAEQLKAWKRRDKDDRRRHRSR